MKAPDHDSAPETGEWTSSSTPYLRPQQPGEPDAWTQESAGRGTQRLTEAGQVTPPAAIRDALGLKDGEAAIIRRRVISLDGSPVELADSYYPERVAAGTALAGKAKIKGGAPTLLASLGYTATRVVEDIEARGATASESDALGIRTGEPVLTLLRTSFSANGVPFEAALMVMRGPHRMRYEMRVD
ncbi:MAG: UTRA domain-containing protein [Catenulispora sp.]|nr:UTRA domain-containing protein [Catenulispora sp.]